MILRTLLCSLALFTSAHACTAFQLKAKDGAWLYGRTMEFGFPMESSLLITPRGIDFIGTAPNETEGLKWRVKYGYVGMNQSMTPTLVSDGMNEKGLIASYLYLPGIAQYEMPHPSKTSRTLGTWELVSFLLGTCATVDDVKTAIASVLVAQEPVPTMGDFVLPLHFYVADRTGAAIVIEYINGERMISDNPLGVLTNSPAFEYQMTHLTEYVNLSPVNVPELKLNGVTVKNFGQGSGLLGLPGDYTPSSRFVRAALFSQWADTPSTAKDGVNLAFHILNTFDIFSGIVRASPKEKDEFNGSDRETTQWSIVHDRTNMKTYFRTYEGLKIQMVDLKKLNLAKGGFRFILLDRSFSAEDITNKEVMMKSPSIPANMD